MISSLTRFPLDSPLLLLFIQLLFSLSLVLFHVLCSCQSPTSHILSSLTSLLEHDLTQMLYSFFWLSFLLTASFGGSRLKTLKPKKSSLCRCSWNTRFCYQRRRTSTAETFTRKREEKEANREQLHFVLITGFSFILSFPLFSSFVVLHRYQVLRDFWPYNKEIEERERRNREER